MDRGCGCQSPGARDAVRVLRPGSAGADSSRPSAPPPALIEFASTLVRPGIIARRDAACLSSVHQLHLSLLTCTQGLWGSYGT